MYVWASLLEIKTFVWEVYTISLKCLLSGRVLDRSWTEGRGREIERGRESNMGDRERQTEIE